MPAPSPYNSISTAWLPSASTGAEVSIEGRDGRPVSAADLQKLEQLDDVIFAALDGDPFALDQAARLWRTLSRQAPVVLVEESREQYVRRAEGVIDFYREEPGEGLARVFAALEVLALLAE